MAEFLWKDFIVLQRWENKREYNNNETSFSRFQGV